MLLLLINPLVISTRTITVMVSDCPKFFVGGHISQFHLIFLNLYCVTHQRLK